jgi:hypothetical protein
MVQAQKNAPVGANLSIADKPSKWTASGSLTNRKPVIESVTRQINRRRKLHHYLWLGTVKR